MAEKKAAEDCEYALSIKQPWASLIVHGLKTIEVRAWPTARRGRILIHAARVSDDRDEGWKMLPAHVSETALLTGGLLGSAEITDCLTYASREEFARDQEAHLNDPKWFKGPRLYGFRFANAEISAFRPLPGWMRFFSVNGRRRAGKA
jgi:hypothetical protein